MQKTGLILSGGGARAAYQVGVLKAIHKILPKGDYNPFDVISGTSAGAINGVALASYADNYRIGIKHLERIWAHFSCDQIYRCDTSGASASFAKMLRAMLIGRQYKHDVASALDNTPLRELLGSVIQFDGIQTAIDNGSLHALAVNCSSLSSNESISFYQGHYRITNWEKPRRRGSRARITLDHLMASSAIPIIFPAVKINKQYYTDGAVHQLSPIRPALHLGAEKIMVISVGEIETTKDVTQETTEDMPYPTPARIFGSVLDAAFGDSIESDMERLTQLNKTLSLVPENSPNRAGLKLKPIQLLDISPSQSLDILAEQYADEAPGMLKFLLGNKSTISGNGAGVLSYLLFSQGFCKALIELGYKDGMQRQDDILEFFSDHLTS